MADVSQLALVSGLTVAVNSTWAVSAGRDPVSPIVAGGVAFVGLSVVGQLWRWDIVNAIAVLFLLSAILFHGIPLGQKLTQLAGVGKTSTPKKGKK